MVVPLPRARPTAITAMPANAATNPRRMPVWPRVPFTAGRRWSTGSRRADRSSSCPVGGGDPARVLGDVGRRVLDQNLVGDERAAGEVAHGDHRDVGLEELRGAA